MALQDTQANAGGAVVTTFEENDQIKIAILMHPSFGEGVYTTYTFRLWLRNRFETNGLRNKIVDACRALVAIGLLKEKTDRKKPGRKVLCFEKGRKGDLKGEAEQERVRLGISLSSFDA